MNENKNYTPILNNILDEMESYCVKKHSKTKFVNAFTQIDNSQLQKIQEIKNKTNSTIVMECFENGEAYKEKKSIYNVEIRCPKCNALYYKLFSKTSMKDILDGKFKNVCPVCENVEKSRVQKKIEAELLSFEERKVENTKQFVEDYLDPNKHWKDGLKAYAKYSEIVNKYNGSNHLQLEAYIKTMPYKEFLKTPYWKAVTDYKKRKAGYACELCCSGGVLNVHHRTYSIHGKEHKCLNDLIVLCQDCHSKFHNKIIGDN